MRQVMFLKWKCDCLVDGWVKFVLFVIVHASLNSVVVIV